MQNKAPVIITRAGDVRLVPYLRDYDDDYDDRASEEAPDPCEHLTGDSEADDSFEIFRDECLTDMESSEIIADWPALVEAPITLGCPSAQPASPPSEAFDQAPEPLPRPVVAYTGPGTLEFEVDEVDRSVTPPVGLQVEKPLDRRWEVIMGKLFGPKRPKARPRRVSNRRSKRMRTRLARSAELATELPPPERVWEPVGSYAPEEYERDRNYATTYWARAALEKAAAWVENLRELAARRVRVCKTRDTRVRRWKVYKDATAKKPEPKHRGGNQCPLCGMSLRSDTVTDVDAVRNALAEHIPLLGGYGREVAVGTRHCHSPTVYHLCEAARTIGVEPHELAWNDAKDVKPAPQPLGHGYWLYPIFRRGHRGGAKYHKNDPRRARTVGERNTRRGEEHQRVRLAKEKEAEAVKSSGQRKAEQRDEQRRARKGPAKPKQDGPKKARPLPMPEEEPAEDEPRGRKYLPGCRWGTVWPTLGRGLCLLNALHSQNRHHRFYEGMLLDMKEETSFMEAFLRAGVKDFLKQKYRISAKDAAALKAFDADGTRPDALDDLTGVEYARLVLGIHRVVFVSEAKTMGNHPTPDEGAEYVGRKDFEEKSRDAAWRESAFVYYDAGHFEYFTCGERLKDFKPTSLLPFKGSDRPRPGDREYIPEPVLVPNKPADHKEPEAPESVAAPEAVEGFIGPMPEPRGNPASNKPLHRDPKDVVQGTYTTQHFIGPEMKPHLLRKRITLTDKPRDYEHGGLRAVADQAHCEATREALGGPSDVQGCASERPIVVAHADKYNKTDGWIEDPRDRSRYYPTRPTVFGEYDRVFRQKNPCTPDFNREFFDDTVEDVLAAIDADPEHKRYPPVRHVACDVFYYPGTLSALGLMREGDRFLFTVGLYPTKVGRYHYFDGEGYVDVYADKIHNKPRGNGSGYTHAPLVLPDNAFSYRSRGKYVNVEQCAIIKTGKHTSHATYRADTSNSPRHPVVEHNDLHPKLSQPILHLQDETKELWNSTRHGAQENFISSTDATVPVHPCWDYYDHLSKVCSSRLGNVDMMLDQQRLAERSYLAEKQKSKAEYFSHEDLRAQTYKFWIQHEAVQRASVVSVLRSKVCYDSNRTAGFVETSGWFACVRRTWRIVKAWAMGNGSSRSQHRTLEKVCGEERQLIVVHQGGGVPVRSRHFDPSLTNKPYHQACNANIRITKIPAGLGCTCTADKYECVIPTQMPVHFGKCQLNTMACLAARGFCSPSVPDKAAVDDFARFVRIEWLNEHRTHFRSILQTIKDEEWTIANFLDEVEPRKRKLYAAGIQKFAEKAKINCHVEMFCKPNEIHMDEVASCRPRMIFNPSPELKGVGSFVARLMIKVIKRIEPGFISGYSNLDLGLKMSHNISQGRFSDENCVSYDGSSHDAHQHLGLIASVDHVIGPVLLEEMFRDPRFPWPETHREELERALFSASYSFSTAEGIRGKITGTVFSGHPTLTTLFNTLRTILYNRYSLHKSGLDHRACSIWAAGDDLLMWVTGGLDKAQYVARLGNAHAPGGLGQVAKDFKIGRLDEHSFLSKVYVHAAGVFLPLAERLYKAGAAKDTTNKVREEDHAAAMMLTELDLPGEVYDLVALRFSGLARGSKSERVAKLCDTEYSWRTRIQAGNAGPDGEAACLATIGTDWHLKLIASHPENPGRNLGMGNRSAAEKTKAEVALKIKTSKPKNDWTPSGARLPGEAEHEEVHNLVVHADGSLSEVRHRGGKTKAEKKNKPKRARLAYLPNNLQLGPTNKGVRKPNKLAKLEGMARDLQVRHTEADLDYLKCLLRPDLYTAKAPSTVPVLSHVTQTKGVNYVAASATGTLGLVLAPWADVGMFQTSTVGIGEGLVLNAATWIQGTAASGVGFQTRRRVVGAYLKVTCLTPDLNRTGVLSVGYYADNCILTGGFTPDSLRDLETTATVYLNDRVSAQAIYLPLDPRSYAFQAPNVDLDGVAGINSGHAPTIAAIVTGAVANAQFAVTYRVVHEIIPLGNYTDLLVPTRSKPSNMTQEAVGKVVDSFVTGAKEVANEKLGQLGDYAINQLDKAGQFVWRNAGRLGAGALSLLSNAATYAKFAAV